MTTNCLNDMINTGDQQHLIAATKREAQNQFLAQLDSLKEAEKCRLHENTATVEKAAQLHSKLSEYAEEYFQDALPAFKFRESCRRALQVAKPTLEKDPVFQAHVEHLEGALAGLGVGYVIPRLINQAVEARLSFFTVAPQRKLQGSQQALQASKSAGPAA